MLENNLLYEQGYSVRINTPVDPLFYYFDYDQRSHDINMEFQHFHDFYEIHILMDSRATHIIDGNVCALQQYDIVLLRPYRMHKTQYPEGPPFKRLIINFAMPKDIPGLENAYKSMFLSFWEEIPIYRLPKELRKAVFDPLNAIFTLSHSTSPLNPVLIHSLFQQFLCALYQRRDQNSYVPEEIGNAIMQKIYSITAYIHSHYNSELSLDFLAKEFFISSYYLSHQFKLITGSTLTEYIQMTRVRNAQQLLIYTRLKISEIAGQCGFNSFSQFNRIFNKLSGMSPSEFRKNQVISNTASTTFSY
ncbi:AraC family transcriptional regulator [Paenibacillus sp. FSL R7-0048]|uniref:helix-turn-helix transcriptional regulator n=1 Tax=Paenibacillus TaxID=44249 RepID=UPI00096F0547|nr:MULTISPECIES: AraC family transcriptional regulator [Paenibacillus]MDH6429410.1 AraC-like DNA-binding protein [Paenibacillus sp. PastH-4]MDH6445617.1 AraC-like DNA-binding protein [Paenibacillus sp. PastF-4]MDH6529505.1 AraC-like DNA-binding protein [Paenibacillus sp. PastH-3]OMD71302.1 AraC family transcriptional regulator [Paenibacillus odorifer]